MQVAESVAPARSPGHASFLSCKYFRSLDLFRFLAIVAVIWHHTNEGFARFPASSRGFLGVDFFFVISGFLIVTLLLRERDRAGSISLRQFYLRRSLRIFPIYYAMLGALAAVFLFVKPQANMARPFFETLPYQAFYLSNFVDLSGSILFFTWSLATEEQFYLAWPPVEKWLRGSAVPLLLGVIVVNQLVNFGVLDGLIGDLRQHLNIFQVTFTPICLGVLLAHVLHDDRGFARASRWLGRPWTSLVLAGLVVLASNNPLPDLAGWPRLLIQVVMTLLLASGVIVQDNWLDRLLGFKAVRRIGVISYGMYLYHEFAAHAARSVLGGDRAAPPLSFFLLTLALTVVVAELSYRFYESPFLRLKDRLGHGSSSKGAMGRPESVFRDNVG
jgi:peptidoglycan/LPS O-acetylase OafA/YrhL